MASSSTSSNRSTPAALISVSFSDLRVEQLLLLVPERAGVLEALVLDGRLLLADHVGDLGLDLLVVVRRLHALHAQAGAGLVDEVDGLVGQVPVGDVAVGQVGRGHHGLVGDRDPVVLLVAVPEALEDLDGVGDRRLLDLDGLEAPLEGGVLLEVLAVLVQRGGADGLQLAPGQHGLEDRGGVDGALGGPRTHQGVELVDEQDDVAAGADLLEHLLEALLEVAAVAGARHQRAEVERVELLAHDRLGHVALGDGLGQALDDGGLAHAGLADEDGVVLGAAGQDLHDPLGLAVAADDRVELLLGGQLGQVAPELVEHERPGLGALLGALAGGGACLLALAGAGVARQELDDLLADPRQVGAELHEDLGGDALALADQAQQDVLGADVVVAELQGLPQGELQHLLGAGREGDVPGRRRAALADDLLDLGANRLQADPEGLEGLGGDAFALVDEAEQDVLGPDVVVVEQPRLFLGEDDHSASPVCEPFEQDCSSRTGGSWLVKSTDDLCLRTSADGAVLPRDSDPDSGVQPDGATALPGRVCQVPRRAGSGYPVRGVVAYRRPVAGNPLTRLPGMTENLERVEARLAESVQADDDFLTEVASHLIPDRHVACAGRLPGRAGTGWPCRSPRRPRRGS